MNEYVCRQDIYTENWIILFIKTQKHQVFIELHPFFFYIKWSYRNKNTFTSWLFLYSKVEIQEKEKRNHTIETYIHYIIPKILLDIDGS